MNWTALALTLQLAAATSAILLVVGTPIAWWLASSTARWKFAVESVVALPLVLPPTVLGFYVLVGMGPATPVGRWLEAIAGSPLPFTFKGLVVASTLYSLPFAVQPLASAFRAVDRKLVEASWLLGASRAATFARVVLPQSIPGVITAAVLSFAHTLGEFGVVLMVGGNIEGVTRTLSIDIYDRVQQLDYGGAARESAVLLALSFAALSAVYAFNRRVWTAGPGEARR